MSGSILRVRVRDRQIYPQFHCLAFPGLQRKVLNTTGIYLTAFSVLKAGMLAFVDLL